MAGALEAAKRIKFSDFITPEGDVFDYDGPEITSCLEELNADLLLFMSALRN